MSKPAIVLDIDETSLSNLPREIANDLGFITGRRESEDLRAATDKNLKGAGYDGWAGLILRPPSANNMTIVGYKSGERGKIAAQGFTIVANVGDQQSDLDGGFAERIYKLPNPIYYLP